MREKILHSSLLMFMKYGIRSVSMDDLASQLGISKKTLYQHFSDKNSLVLAATRSYFENERCVCFGFIEHHQNPMDQIMLLYNHLLKEISGFNPNLVYDLMKYHPDAWAELEEYRINFIKNHIYQNLKQGIEQQYYRGDINVEIVTGLYLHLINGAIDQQLFPPGNYSLATIYIQLIELYLRGICTPKGAEYFEKNHKLLYNETN